MPPETRYAKDGDGYIAYQVLGDGPNDIVLLTGWNNDLIGQWENPFMARYLERLASFSRLVVFNRRGQGRSDPIELDDGTLERWMENVGTVMDAAGSERAAIVSAPETGPLAIMWAATHPERTTALVLINTFARYMRDVDYPFGPPAHVMDAAAERYERAFVGEPVEADPYGYASSDPQEVLEAWRMARRATSPAMGARLLRLSSEMDVRDVLPTVRVPTLVIHRAANRWTRVENGRFLAERIGGAKYVELPGDSHFPWNGPQQEIVDEIEEFLTGVRPISEPDRVLSTVLFTDVVSSTEQAVHVGDRRWREILDAHDRVVRRELERQRGREVNTAGDGFLATFDGPARAVRCACGIVDAVGDLGLELRAGVHTGEVELRGDDVAGIAVNIGSRVSELAGPGEVLVSRTVVDLVAGSGLSFADRGAHELKGVPGEFQLFVVER